jgi:hypothetical protein
MKCVKQMWKWIFIMLTYANMNMKRIWQSYVLKIGVEHTKGNDGSYLYLYHFGDLVQKNFQGGFYARASSNYFLITFLTKSYLLITWNLTGT